MTAVPFSSPFSLADGGESAAQRDRPQQVGQPVAVSGELLPKPVQHRLVRRRGGRPGRPGVDTLDQAGAELRVIVQRLREPREVVELTAVERAARIDGRAALGRAVLARAVEMLEREPDRVGDLVAAGTDRVGAMHVEALPRRAQARVRVFQQREVDVGRRARHRLTEQ